jgi:acyl transferase domain-containing protein
MKTAVVICPGRGTYNKDELGYLARHFPDPRLMDDFNKARTDAEQDALTSLDGTDRFSAAKHTRGDNASGLIYAATLGDHLSIDRDKIDIVAVTGNSMGWYSALACGGAATPQAGFEISNTMGTLMQQALIGGQLIYPFVGDDWAQDMARKAALLDTVAGIGARKDHVLSLSIDLGGMLVLAGNDAGLDAFEASVPRLQGRFPMRLPNHAAFHTQLQEPVAEEGRAHLSRDLIGKPKLPLIDGRGAIWWPHASDTDALYDYTLGAQVTQTYDFTRAITVAAREFAPDLFIITGPGTTLGGAVAQSLILSNWQGLCTKSDFQSRQADAPFLISMGNVAQRAIVTKEST